MSGWIIHRNPHPDKGFAFKDLGVWYTVDDWYDRVTGRKFMDEYGNDRLTKGYRNMIQLELAHGNRVPVDEDVVVAVSNNAGVRVFHTTQIQKMKGAKDDRRKAEG